MTFNYDLPNVLQDEGFRSKPYHCTEGYLTVGHGINLDAGITEEESRLIVEHRLHEISVRLRQNIESFDGFPDEIKNVLCNMAYNLGVTGLLKFKRMIAALELGMYSEAADEMLDSKWARQVPNRANRLIERVRELA